MSKRSLSLVVVLLLALATIGLVGCNSSTPEPAEQPASTEPAATEPTELETSPEPTAAVTELQIEDLKDGSGAEAKTGDTVTVDYTLYLTDGTKIESSKDSGQPFSFTIGEGKVIPGWEQGVPGMKEGGTRKLTIPPDLAYGEAGAGAAIPPNATLVFEIDLISVD